MVGFSLQIGKEYLDLVWVPNLPGCVGFLQLPSMKKEYLSQTIIIGLTMMVVKVEEITKPQTANKISSDNFRPGET